MTGGFEGASSFIYELSSLIRTELRPSINVASKRFLEELKIEKDKRLVEAKAKIKELEEKLLIYERIDKAFKGD